MACGDSVAHHRALAHRQPAPDRRALVAISAGVSGLCRDTLAADFAALFCFRADAAAAGRSAIDRFRANTAAAGRSTIDRFRANATAAGRCTFQFLRGTTLISGSCPIAIEQCSGQHSIRSGHVWRFHAQWSA